MGKAQSSFWYPSTTVQTAVPFMVMLVHGGLVQLSKKLQYFSHLDVTYLCKYVNSDFN